MRAATGSRRRRSRCRRRRGGRAHSHEPAGSPSTSGRRPRSPAAAHRVGAEQALVDRDAVQPVGGEARGSGKARSPCRWSGAVVPEALRRAREATRGAHGEPARPRKGRIASSVFSATSPSTLHVEHELGPGRGRVEQLAELQAPAPGYGQLPAVPEDRQRPDGPQVPDLEPPPVERMSASTSSVPRSSVARSSARQLPARCATRNGLAPPSEARDDCSQVTCGEWPQAPTWTGAEARKGLGRASAASGPGPSPPLRGGCVPPSQGGSHDA